jgi:hypothetical protein
MSYDHNPDWRRPGMSADDIAQAAAKEASLCGAAIAYVWIVNKEGIESSEMILPKNANIRHISSILDQINKHLGALQDKANDRFALAARIERVEKAIKEIEEKKQ